mgnify:CR=1
MPTPMMETLEWKMGAISGALLTWAGIIGGAAIVKIGASIGQWAGWLK